MSVPALREFQPVSRDLRRYIREAVEQARQKGFAAGYRTGERATMERFVGLLDAPAKGPHVAEIQRAVADHFKLGVAELKSHRRSRYIARPRQVAMYLCRETTQFSLPEIGRFFGGRDHSTVLHAIHTVAALCAGDSSFAAEVEQLREQLSSRAAA